MADDATVRRNRLIASAILAVFVFGGLGAGLAVGLFGRAAQPTVRIGGPLTLTDKNGAKFSDTDLRGKPFTVSFGFTHCPEVCPTTLWEMSEALKALGPDADSFGSSSSPLIRRATRRMCCPATSSPSTRGSSG